MDISIIAAIGKKNELGNGNKLLWKLPDDLQRFKALTLTHCVVMGSKTYQSIGKPLPGRTNIVLSREIKNIDGVQVLQSVNEVLEFAQSKNENELFVIGGGQIYALFMPLCTKLYLTKVDFEGDVDTYFPHIEPRQWHIAKETHHPKDEKNEYEYTFLDLVKKY